MGRNVISEQINLIKLAESKPCVKRFFPSEYGTDIEYCSASAAEKPHQQKLQVRNYIKTSIKRLSYTYLVTGPYADLYLAAMPNQPQVGSFDVESRTAVLLGDESSKVSFTTMTEYDMIWFFYGFDKSLTCFFSVGKLLVAAIRHPRESHNKALKVNSFTATPKEIIEEFEKQTGSAWNVSYNSLEVLKKLEQEAWRDNNPIAGLYTLRRIWTEGGTLYDKVDNEVIGAVEMESFSTAVQKAVESCSVGFRSGKM